ncbi:MAG: hypothetical protein WBP56_09905 [Polyangia bacterium]
MNLLTSWRPSELPDSWAPTHGWALARALAVVAILVVAGFVALERPWVTRRLSVAARRLGRRVLLGVLGVSAVLAVATYVDFGVFRYGTYLNEWDFYHYYVGTKYAHELGYTNLYGATLVADHEGGLRYHNPRHEIRDLATAELRDVGEVAGEAARYRGRFSDTRWREFVADITWFKMQLPPNRWSLILADHGYNGTPAWTFVVGGLVTRHLSVRNPVSRWLMLALDPLLLLAASLAVAWAFGLRTALLLVVFVGTHYLLSWGHLKGALLRTDFAMASVLAVCLVKQRYYKIAGVLLGWAILSRIFPAFLLIGPTVLLLGRLARSRSIDRQLLGLLGACAATVTLGMLGSCAYFGTTGIWREWSLKIATHYSGGSDWDLGYRTLAEASFVNGVPARAVVHAVVQSPALFLGRPATVVAMLLVLPALTFIRGLADHEALAYGFVFVFLFALAAYYYYLVLCVPLLFFAPQLERPQHALGVACMFFTGIVGYVLFSGWPPLAGSWVMFRGWRQTFPTYYFLCYFFTVTVAQMILLAGSKTLRAERRPSGGSPQPSVPEPR